MGRCKLSVGAGTHRDEGRGRSEEGGQGWDCSGEEGRGGENTVE